MARPVTTLQRLSHALALSRDKVRSTDWWALFVELAVVVIGILIAFELANWGERRARVAAERELLQRIEEEARGDYEKLKSARDAHEESVENYRLLASAMEDPAALAIYRRRGQAQCNLLRLPGVARQSAGPGGLAAGERLDLISDPGLRTLLRQADAQRVFSDSQLVFFREAFQRYADVIEPHMPWRFAANGGFECGVDIDSLRADPRAVELLPKLARDQRQFVVYRKRELDATKAVIDRVACLRGGTCP